MFIRSIFYINLLVSYKNTKYSFKVSLVTITLITFLIITGTISTPSSLLLQMANAQTAAAGPNTTHNNSNDISVGAKLSSDYGTKGKTFETINERFKVSNATLANNDNFKFFSDLWHDMSHGDIFLLQYSKNPLNTILKLVPVLNPIPNGPQDYKAMKLGQTIITPAPASRDNRSFTVASDVPNGYYIVNAYAKYGGTNNFGEVFTGKIRLLNATSSHIGNQLHSVKTIIHRVDGGYRPVFGGPCNSPSDLFDPIAWVCITPDGALYVVAENNANVAPQPLSSPPCQVDVNTGVCATNLPPNPSPTTAPGPDRFGPDSQRGGGHHHNGGNNNPSGGGGGGGTPGTSGGGNEGGGGVIEGGGGSAAPPSKGSGGSNGGPTQQMQMAQGGGGGGDASPKGK